MAYSHFHAHKPKAIAESMLKEGKDKLKQLMGGARAVLEEELSRKALRNTALDELHSQYDENVKMQTEGKIVTEEMLRSLKQEIPFSQITATADIGVDDIEKQKDNAMKRNVQRNKLLMEKKNVELGKRKQDIVDGILWRTEKTDNFYVDGEELDKNLSEMKEQSIESLETSIQQHFLSKEDCSDHVRNGLRHVLDVVSTVFRRRNKRYEVVMNSMLEMQKLRIMIDYSEEMGKVLQDKYLDPDGLDALHNETADAIVPDFTNEKTPLFLMKHGVRVRQELDQELEKYKEINEENKPFYRQVAGKASGALGAMGVAAGGAAGGFILAEVLVTAAVVTGAASVGIGALGVLVVGAGTYISKRIREKRFEELRLQIKCTLREDAKKLIKKLQQ